MFRDITPLLASAEGLRQAIVAMAEPWKDKGITAVLAAEARGFILGSCVALELHAGFIPLRKPGKLPGKTESVSFSLEYGEERLEVHRDPFPSGKKVLLLDDVLATGGTAKGMLELAHKLDAQVAGFSFLLEIQELNGRAKIKDITIESLIKV